MLRQNDINREIKSHLSLDVSVDNFATHTIDKIDTNIALQFVWGSDQSEHIWVKMLIDNVFTRESSGCEVQVIDRWCGLELSFKLKNLLSLFVKV